MVALADTAADRMPATSCDFMRAFWKTNQGCGNCVSRAQGCDSGARVWTAALAVPYTVICEERTGAYCQGRNAAREYCCGRGIGGRAGAGVGGGAGRIPRITEPVACRGGRGEGARKTLERLRVASPCRAD